jgi:hypothetical protein
MPSPVHLIQCLQHAAPDSFARGSVRLVKTHAASGGHGGWEAPSRCRPGRGRTRCRSYARHGQWPNITSATEMPCRSPDRLAGRVVQTPAREGGGALPEGPNFPARGRLACSYFFPFDALVLSGQHRRLGTQPYSNSPLHSCRAPRETAHPHLLPPQAKVLRLRPHLLGLFSRSLTPGPPPFASMNSTPAVSRTRRTAKSLAVVIDVSLSTFSARRIVASPRAALTARSSALQRTRPRAALIWAPVRGFEVIVDFIEVM